MYRIVLFAESVLTTNPLPQVNADSSTTQDILTAVFGLLGGLAVLFIVIGGFRYITAAGEPTKTASARNQILYSVVGLVVAGMAEVLVNYVLTF